MEEQFLNDFINKFQGDEEIYTKFLMALRTGNNKAFHGFVSEHFTLDDDWIYTIDGALVSVENIVRNPRRFIREEYDVVAVEKARRINSKTIQHLSSHTQYIQSGRNEDVRPSKLLVGQIEEDLAIYENRFVFSLIERVTTFVEKRYVDISARSKNFDKTNLKMHSAFKMGRNEFECDFDIKVKEPSRDEAAEAKLNEQFERIEIIRKRLRVIKNSDFYRELSNSKPVKPPIQKTNMIRMNTDYSHCYNLWLFVSAYNTLGYSVDVTEKMLPIAGDYYDDLTVISALAIQSLVTDGNLRRSVYKRVSPTKRTDQHYKVVQNFKYTADFGADTKKQGEDAVNEYYFRQMRNELVRAVKRNQLEEEKELDLNFRHFYRSIAKINGEMYKDVINSEYEKQPKGRSVIQKREAAVKNQKVLLKRYHQLAQLQKWELEKTLRLEKREVLKLEKLQIELDKAKKRRLEKIERDKKKKLKTIDAQPEIAQQNADDYEQELRDRLLEKQLQKEEEKRKRREDAKLAREYKKYLELKEKFDGKND